VDYRERFLDEEETLHILLENLQSRLYTSLVGVVQSIGVNGQTVSVQLAHDSNYRNSDGDMTPLPFSQILDCPILWQGGGGVTATFPIKQGDECLVLVAARNINAWWAQGLGSDGTAPPTLKFRMHNLSDGFALVGVRSKPRGFTVSTTAAQLRSDDGETVFSLNPTAQTIEATAPGGINLNGLTIDGSGNITHVGNVTTVGTVAVTGAITVDGVTVNVP
jgi:hypothetical protein